MGLALGAAALLVLVPVAAPRVAALGAAPAAAATPAPPQPGAEPEPPQTREAPSPAPTPTPSSDPDGNDSGNGVQEEPPTAGQECGAFDYACKVTEALNTWLISTVTDMANAGLVTAAVGMISTPPPTSGIEDAWRISQQVTSTVYVLVVTVAGVLVMTNPSVQTSASLKEVLPRVLLGFVGANASWFLCSLMADVGNGAALGLVSDTATPESVAQAIGRIIANPEGELFIVVLLFLVANLLAVFLYFAVLIRIVLWLLLTAIAPIALACHALPQTDGLARLWWRAMSALLIIQVAQALVLRIAVTVFLNREQMQALDPGGTVGSLADVALLICCLYVLVRIPFWAFKQVFNLGNSPAVKGLKLAVSLLVFRNIGKALAGAKGAKAGGQAARQGAQRTAARTTAARRPPTRAARWHQPRLPLQMPAPKTQPQQPIPGIDRQIDPTRQRRLRERRRWVQPTLPEGALGRRSRPAWHRQPALPGMQGPPQGRQEPIPGLRTPPPARQEALFEPTPQMRRPSRRPAAPSQPRRENGRNDPGGSEPVRPGPSPRPPAQSSGGAERPTPYHQAPQPRPIRPTPRHRPRRDNPGRRS
ncbi:hypothetical protein [Streptomonospora salina]|uniref:TrbL/VirB6 plasmid conjugal transfer protein n=1 Tax=Streptomonospora salina TaxID=104205 RepID=A0A841EC48_9ACTN|nr:hypothetical protein [Streptomonospora salina]MBB5998050.1 hypothetical protein [Streptomonospora salina]